MHNAQTSVTPENSIHVIANGAWSRWNFQMLPHVKKDIKRDFIT